jgi:hypothetical protein
LATFFRSERFNKKWVGRLFTISSGHPVYREEWKQTFSRRPGVDFINLFRL